MLQKLTFPSRLAEKHVQPDKSVVACPKAISEQRPLPSVQNPGKVGAAVGKLVGLRVGADVGFCVGGFVGLEVGGGVGPSGTCVPVELKVKAPSAEP